MATTIETQRLTLRPLAMSDAPTIAALIGDYDVSRWLTVVPHPYTVQDAEYFIENSQSDWCFAITLNGCIIGVISADKQLGYWLGVAHWGQGYMGEVTNAVVSAWFGKSGADLKSGFFPENARSGAILRNLGFRPTKIVASHSLAQGRDVDLQEMTLSRADWQAHHG